MGEYLVLILYLLILYLPTYIILYLSHTISSHNLLILYLLLLYLLIYLLLLYLLTYTFSYYIYPTISLIYLSIYLKHVKYDKITASEDRKEISLCLNQYIITFMKKIWNNWVEEYNQYPISTLP